MRWGVRDEATDDHMTTELCMKEIDNCQRLSMCPNFVVSILIGINVFMLQEQKTVYLMLCKPRVKVFLAQKYGYRTIPTYILASELAQFREVLVSMGNEVILLLLDTWYKKDTNAVPPICIFQTISSILTSISILRSVLH
jgi:hypothetical protein